MDKTKELLKKAFYRGNEVADMPSYYYEGLADEWEKWYSDNVKNILPLHVVSYCDCEDSHKITMTTRKCVACKKLVNE